MDDIFDNSSNEEFIDRPEEFITGITLEEDDEEDELDWAEAIDMDQSSDTMIKHSWSLCYCVCQKNGNEKQRLKRETNESSIVLLKKKMYQYYYIYNGIDKYI